MPDQEMLTRDKILHSAMGLFLERGYEKTSVQAIIDAVGIAKGTFYHHFPTKEGLLVLLVQAMSRRVVDAIKPIVDDPSLTAIEKILAMSAASAGQKLRDLGPESIVLVRQMRLRENRLLAESIEEISTQWLRPLYAQCIRQGVDEGVFQVRDADMASELFIGALMGVKDRLFDLFVAALDGDESAGDRLMDVYESVEEAAERLLGSARGSLPIYTSLDVRGFLARAREKA